MPKPFHREHDRYIAGYLRCGDAKIIGVGRSVLGQRKDGSTFPMELAIGELHDGKRRLFTAIIRDITERKELEKAIAGSVAEEQRAIGRELHDAVAQQLAGIGMLAQSLKRQLETAASPQAQAAQEIGQLIHDANDRIRALIKNPGPECHQTLQSALPFCR